MAYRTSANYWMLTTGLPIESIIMIRDHLGNCFDMSTLTMMEWKFLPVTNDEPETPHDLAQGECIMPTCERWHCVMTEKERATSTGMHLLDWQPYQKSWDDEYLSLRHADTNPPDKPLTLAEWAGTKVWHPDNFEQPTFPSTSVPISMASREANLIGHLAPSKGNLWKLLYDTMNSLIQKSEYYSWDRFVEGLETVDLSDVHWSPPKEFDSRFYYYSREINLTELLSTDEGRETTEEKEVAKTSLYGMNEFPSLETRLIPEESELVKGRKRSLEEGMLPPPQKGRKGGTRRSSVPPGSETAKARARAEAQRSQDVKGKGSGKGTSKGGGKEPSGKGISKLPPTFIPTASGEKDPDTPIAQRKEAIINKKFYDRSWNCFRKCWSSME